MGRPPLGGRRRDDRARRRPPSGGCAPYPRYVFFNLLTESGGGLEHKNACTLMSSRWRDPHPRGVPRMAGAGQPRVLPRLERQAPAAGRARAVRLRARGLHPRPLGRRGVHLLLRRPPGAPGGLLHRQGVPEGPRARSIETLQTTPGRLVQPLDESSFDAWIKFYRRDENSTNTGISYYTKGEVVAFLLDARIRRATGGRRSLDDAMRLAFQRYSGEHGFRPEELRRTFEEVAGIDLGGWLHARRRDRRGARLPGGARLVRAALRGDDAGEEGRRAEGAAPPAGWGWTAAIQDGRLTVTRGEARHPRLRGRASTSATRSSPSTTTGCRPKGWRGG